MNDLLFFHSHGTRSGATQDPRRAHADDERLKNKIADA